MGQSASPREHPRLLGLSWISISCMKHTVQVNRGQRWRRAGLWKRQGALPPEPALTGPPWKSPAPMNLGCSPTHWAKMFCLQAGSAPLPPPREPGERVGESVVLSLALCHTQHSSCSMSHFMAIAESREFPSFIVSTFLNHSGNLFLTFICVFINFHLKQYVCSARELQGFTKKTSENCDLNPSDEQKR